MTDERDENGELLPDDVRLTKFGAWLRKTSLDELAEVFNILNGTMSVIGPRPQLVRDMTFMTKSRECVIPQNQDFRTCTGEWKKCHNMGR